MAQKRNHNAWKGPERRECPNHGACLDHTGLVVEVKTNAQKIRDVESQRFVPFNHYKWAIGIVFSVLISLFSIAIYLSVNTNSSLHEISAKQQTTIYKISDIKNDIDDLKRTNSDELKEIKRSLHQHNNP